jgi:hypothetical protein
VVVDDPTIDLTFPIILLTLGDLHPPIDGWHRITKALTVGVEKIPAVVLTEAESQQVQDAGSDIAAKRRTT